MGITGPTPTQPAKTHTHACMGMDWGGLGEGQLWVGYGYNPRWVTLGYPSARGNLVYIENTDEEKLPESDGIPPF